MKFKVPGMMCMHCVKSVTDALNGMEGVGEVQVELASKEVTLQADESMRDAIINVIEDLGFDIE